MASIYDKSSLVLIPSGTKTGKVFSQKPVSGDGDFTFTRASAATRVNADGNIEKETGNLLAWSNSFNNWTKALCTATSGQSGYDGSSDAWLLTATGSGNSCRRNVTYSGVSSFSVYAKAGTADGIRLRFDAATDKNLMVNLTDGSVISAVTTAFAYSVEDVGSGWYRVTATADLTSGINVRLIVTDDTGTQSTGSVYIQDAQLEQGLVARDYQETTTAAVYGGITDNTPRLDYTDSSCPALLLEPQRTNLITQSEYFNSSYWIKGGSPVFSVSDNAGISPEGVSNATRFVAASAQQSTRLYTSVTWTAVPYTISLYVKNNGGTNTNIRFSYYDGSGQYFSPTFTLTDEWQRIEYTFTPTASSGGFWLVNTPTAGLNLDLLAFAAQLEISSYPTSYIPTYGSSVSRVAETCTKGSASSVIGQNEGVIFAEVDFKGGSSTDTHRFSINDSGSNNWIFVSIEGGSNLRYYIRVGSNTYIDGNVGNKFVAGNTYKIALRYKSGDTAVYINGIEIGSGNTTAFPSPTTPFSRYSITGSANNSDPVQFTQSGVKQTLLFPTSLSNEELAALTTI